MDTYSGVITINIRTSKLGIYGMLRDILIYNAIYCSWDGVFSDPESGISRYSWSVGSQPGYDDMMGFTDRIDVCAQTDENTPLHLEEGHSYYVSVKVCCTTT